MATTVVKNNIYFNQKDIVLGIGRKTVGAGIIMMSSQAWRFVLQLGSTMILARLLTPDDFGIFSMVAVLLSFISILRAMGLADAVIQRAKIDEGEVSNLFWINCVVAISATILLITSAKFVANFYGRIELVDIILVLSVVALLQSMPSIHRALLARSMEFKKLAIIDALSATLSVIVAIVLALNNFKYWALVGQIAAAAIFECILLFVSCSWTPRRFKRTINVKSYIRYGGNLAGFNMLNFFSRNADNIMIGRVCGGGALGGYSRAYSLLMLPLNQLNVPMTRVMLPILSKMQDDEGKYRKAYMKAISTVLAISFPVIGYFLLTSESLILLFLGDAWFEAVPIFKALIPAAFVSALNITTGWIYLSRGTTHRQLKWTLFVAPFNVGMMYIGLLYGGVYGVAIAISTAFVLVRVPYYIYTYSGTPIVTYHVLKLVSRLLILVLVSCGLVHIGFNFFDDYQSKFDLIYKGIAYSAVVFFLDQLFFARKCITLPLIEVINIYKNK